jgi:mono/diheme cytochrome c family protein
MRSIVLLLCLAGGSALAQIAPASRGQLLYTTYCIECHTARMHWRDARLARDWESLRGQVRRWQGEARLAWSEEDIEAVTRYLNEGIYGFPQPQTVGAARAIR